MLELRINIPAEYGPTIWGYRNVKACILSQKNLVNRWSNIPARSDM